ncbi:MAG TPA: rhomboid family intramembrane serine protease [Vicinamibacterales bacterium]|nr:rhomboid family intramembrane serine protease [Vicinamibacterales bacterium]
MVFPIRDDNTGRTRTPYVTYALIALNVFVFVFFQGLGANDRFTYAFSTIPQEIRTGKDVAGNVPVELGGERGTIPLQPTPVAVYLTLITAMFMHGGLMHLLGNMWFLWIFGDNVEDDLSHGRYLVFYLLTGVLASLAHVVSTFVLGDNPYIPSLGASGAISGVMGGYLVLHPRRRVTVILLRMLTDVPGYVAVGLWFAFQLISAFGVIGQGPQAGGGVAFMAHVGGFVAGVVLVKLFAVGSQPPMRRASPW